MCEIRLQKSWGAFIINFREPTILADIRLKPQNVLTRHSGGAIVSSQPILTISIQVYRSLLQIGRIQRLQSFVSPLPIDIITPRTGLDIPPEMAGRLALNKGDIFAVSRRSER